MVQILFCQPSHLQVVEVAGQLIQAPVDRTAVTVVLVAAGQVTVPVELREEQALQIKVTLAAITELKMVVLLVPQRLEGWYQEQALLCRVA
jgi:hypothetical protein